MVFPMIPCLEEEGKSIVLLQQLSLSLIRSSVCSILTCWLCQYYHRRDRRPRVGLGAGSHWGCRGRRWYQPRPYEISGLDFSDVRCFCYGGRHRAWPGDERRKSVGGCIGRGGGGMGVAVQLLLSESSLWLVAGPRRQGPPGLRLHFAFACLSMATSGQVPSASTWFLAVAVTTAGSCHRAQSPPTPTLPQ